MGRHNPRGPTPAMGYVYTPPCIATQKPHAKNKNNGTLIKMLIIAIPVLCLLNNATMPKTVAIIDSGKDKEAKIGNNLTKKLSGIGSPSLCPLYAMVIAHHDNNVNVTPIAQDTMETNKDVFPKLVIFILKKTKS